MPFKIPDTPEELFRQGRQSMDQFNRLIPYFILLIILLGASFSSFYSISEQGGEVGVITRFGKYVRTTNPGLHWKLPLIEQLYKVETKLKFKDEFGFRTTRAGERSQYSAQSFDEESLMLTGDLNVLDVSWIVQYVLYDPVKVLFNIRNPRDTVRAISESVMRQVIGDSSVTEALTTRRIDINTEVKERLQKILDDYQSGIHIDTVQLQDVVTPEEVRPSFNEVNEAEQEKEKLINQSWEAYNQAIPRASGQSEQTVREAEGYALRRINEAQGDAARFLATWEAYQSAKDVTRRRMYLETMADVLPKAGEKYILDPEGSSVLPLLKLQQSKKE